MPGLSCIEIRTNPALIAVPDLKQDDPTADYTTDYTTDYIEALHMALTGVTGALMVITVAFVYVCG